MGRKQRPVNSTSPITSKIGPVERAGVTKDVKKPYVSKFSNTNLTPKSPSFKMQNS
jgi:hypothetical protein